MDDIDEVLARLARTPPPAVLDGLEARVLSRIGTLPASRVQPGLGVIMIAALAIGMIGAGFPAASVPATSPSPLGAVIPLAPSTLLAGAP